MQLELTRATCLGETIKPNLGGVLFLHESDGLSWGWTDINHAMLYNLKKQYETEWSYNHWKFANTATRDLFIKEAMNLVAPSQYFFIESENLYRDVIVDAKIINDEIGYFSHNNPYIAASLLYHTWLLTNDIKQKNWWEHSTIVLDHSISNVLTELQSKGASVRIESDYQCAPVLLAEHDNAYEFVCSPDVEPMHTLIRNHHSRYHSIFDDEVRFGNWRTNEYDRMRFNSTWDGSIWIPKPELNKWLKICSKYSIPIIYP